MAKARVVRETKAMTINGHEIPGRVVAAVRERMATRRFREGEVIVLLREAGLQGLAAVALHREFVRREVKAGRIREEDGLLTGTANGEP
jgi:hypothetical protein